MNGSILHWDYENSPVPRGVTVSSVLNEMRSMLHTQYGAILAAYVYADPHSLTSTRRQELSANGLDIIDCSRASGKMNAVDFRIVTRALADLARTEAHRPAVVLVTGDGDFCYTLSTLRNVGVKTHLIFDSDRRSVVNSSMLQAAEFVHGMSFGGHDSEPLLDSSVTETAASTDFINAALPNDGESEYHEERNEEDILLSAIERAPQADDDGFRFSTSVGELFHRLSSARTPEKESRKAAFRRAKSALVKRNLIEVRNDERNTPLMRVRKNNGMS